MMRKRIMAGPSITKVERNIVADALKEENWYEHRYDYVEKFEREFAKYHNRKYGLMTTNCHQALYILLYALGIEKGEEVIVPNCTWTGSVAPVTFFGAKPVFVDIQKDNWCINPEEVKKAITKKTKAVIAVDLYGNMPDMDKLKRICKKHKIYLIEDCAEAVGSKYKNQRAGSFGIGSVFSFHCTKTLTCGEGGIVLMNDVNLYERAKFIRDCGRDPQQPYKVLDVSLKHIPSNFQAALVYAQFTRIKEIVDKKRWIFKKYKEKLKHIKGLQFNVNDKNTYNGVWATSIVWDDDYRLTKEEVMKQLEKMNLPSRAFFYPLSSQLPYRKYKTLPTPVTDSISGITLPSALIITEKEIDEYCKGLMKIFNGNY